jgi:hypothetical protein
VTSRATVPGIPSLLTDFKISNFVTSVTLGQCGIINIPGVFLPQYKKKKKISFSALKKKVSGSYQQQCTQLKLALVPVSVRNLGKSYRAKTQQNTIHVTYVNVFSVWGTSEKLRENIFSRKCCCN